MRYLDLEQGLFALENRTMWWAFRSILLQEILFRIPSTLCAGGVENHLAEGLLSACEGGAPSHTMIDGWNKVIQSSLHRTQTSSVRNLCVQVLSSRGVSKPVRYASSPACAIIMPLSIQKRSSVA
jgi:hypothetical protein